MPELLRVDKLSSGYADAVVLHDVSLTLGEGQTLALLGRNGVGKTTFMDTLAGATQHHSGHIFLGDIALHSLPSHQRAIAGVGWVPQERNIFKSLTVHENLTSVWRTHKSRSNPNQWTPERIYGMFPRLAERKTNMGNQLSGGEQQMLAIGRALVLNPKILLLDEPLEGLAPIICEALLRAIKCITREDGISIIIVEQHPQAVLNISHHAVVLDQGRVIHSGDAKTLKNAPDLIDKLIGLTGH